VYVSSEGDYVGWLAREAGARKFKPVKDVAVAIARVAARPHPLPIPQWHLTRPLGEVRAGCQLELVRSVEGFSGPWGLAVGPRGEIFVAEYLGDRVAVVSEEGAVLRRFECGQNPLSVSVDAQGRVLVSIFSPKRLLRFAADGTREREIGPLPAGGNGGGVCALRDGGIAVANCRSGTVTIFPPDLVDPTTVEVGDVDVFGVAESREGHLLLTSRSSGVVLSCDRAGRKIGVFQNLTASIGLSGEVGQPALSAEGAVLLAACNNNVVLLLDRNGQLVDSFTPRSTPSAVAVLPGGGIVVSTFTTGELHFLRLKRP
jgi:DNA-binding beta-propeller fold protein YncE